MNKTPDATSLVEEPFVKQLASALAKLNPKVDDNFSLEEMITTAMIEASQKLKAQGIALTEETPQLQKEDLDTRVLVVGDFSLFQNFVCAYALHLVYGDLLEVAPYAGASQKLTPIEGVEKRGYLICHIGNIGVFSPKNFSVAISIANKTGPDFGSISYAAMRADLTIVDTDKETNQTLATRRIINAQPVSSAKYTQPHQLLQQALFYAYNGSWVLDAVPGSLPTPVFVGQDQDVRKINFQKLLYVLDNLSSGQNEFAGDGQKLFELIQRLDLSFDSWDNFFSNFEHFGLS